MSKLAKWVALIGAAAVLAGCVVVPRGYYHHHNHGYYDRYDDDGDRGRGRGRGH